MRQESNKKNTCGAKCSFCQLASFRQLKRAPTHYVGTRGKLRVATKCDKCRNTWGLTKGFQLDQILLFFIRIWSDRGIFVALFRLPILSNFSWMFYLPIISIITKKTSNFCKAESEVKKENINCFKNVPTLILIEVLLTFVCPP